MRYKSNKDEIIRIQDRIGLKTSYLIVIDKYLF